MHPMLHLLSLQLLPHTLLLLPPITITIPHFPLLLCPILIPLRTLSIPPQILSRLQIHPQLTSHHHQEEEEWLLQVSSRDLVLVLMVRMLHIMPIINILCLTSTLITTITLIRILQQLLLQQPLHPCFKFTPPRTPPIQTTIFVSTTVIAMDTTIAVIVVILVLLVIKQPVLLPETIPTTIIREERREDQLPVRNLFWGTRQDKNSVARDLELMILKFILIQSSLCNSHF